MNVALWVLQILFAALFMLHAVLHLFPSPRLKGILAQQNIPVKRTIATWAEVVASLGLILPGTGQHRHVAHAAGCARSRCGDGRGDSVPCVPVSLFLYQALPQVW